MPNSLLSQIVVTSSDKRRFPDLSGVDSVPPGGAFWSGFGSLGGDGGADRVFFRAEEYLEALYRIRRRQATTPEARDALTNAHSDLQARDRPPPSLLHVEPPDVAQAYFDLKKSEG